MRRVPTCFIKLANLMLTGRSTRLKFDDYLSNPIPLGNGTTQGDPSSMLYYTFYNAPLIETANSDDELSGLRQRHNDVSHRRHFGRLPRKTKRYDGKARGWFRLVILAQLPLRTLKNRTHELP